MMTEDTEKQLFEQQWSKLEQKWSQEPKKKVIIIKFDDNDVKVPDSDVERVTKIFESCEIQGDYNKVEIKLSKIDPKEVLRIEKEGFYGENSDKSEVQRAIEELGLDKQQMTEEELNKEIDKMFSDMGSGTPIGKMMGESARRFKGQVSMELVSKKVNERYTKLQKK
jgi:hypothetical protein